MAKRGRKAAKSPDAPDEIIAPSTLNAAEEREFRRLVDACREAGTLARADARLIEDAAKMQVLLDRAREELGSGPMTLKAANGTLMPHPMIAVIGSYSMRLRGLRKDLGLTSSPSKSNDKPGKPEGDGRWGDLLSVGA